MCSLERSTNLRTNPSTSLQSELNHFNLSGTNLPTGHWPLVTSGFSCLMTLQERREGRTKKAHHLSLDSALTTPHSRYYPTLIAQDSLPSIRHPMFNTYSPTLDTRPSISGTLHSVYLTLALVAISPLKTQLRVSKPPPPLPCAPRHIDCLCYLQSTKFKL